MFPGFDTLSKIAEYGGSAYEKVKGLFSDAAEKENGKKEKGWMEKMWGYLNPFNVAPAFGKAWEKATESKNAGFFERVMLFFSTFSKEINDVEEEEKKVTDETEAEVQAAVAETTGEAAVDAEVQGAVIHHKQHLVGVSFAKRLAIMRAGLLLLARTSVALMMLERFVGKVGFCCTYRICLRSILQHMYGWIAFCRARKLRKAVIP